MAKNESYYSGEKYNSLAKKHGYRSRAAFKLIQIDKEENILKKIFNIKLSVMTPTTIKIIKFIFLINFNRNKNTIGNMI